MRVPDYEYKPAKNITKDTCGTCRFWADTEIRAVRPMRLCERKSSTLQAFTNRNDVCEMYRPKR